MLENIFFFNLIRASMSRASLFLLYHRGIYFSRDIHSYYLLEVISLTLSSQSLPSFEAGGKIMVRFQKKSSSHSRLFQPCP